MHRIISLIALAALTTACGGGDIEVKTDLGETYIVKDSAVTTIDQSQLLDDRSNVIIKEASDGKARGLGIKQEYDRCMRSYGSFGTSPCDIVWTPKMKSVSNEMASLNELAEVIAATKNASKEVIKQVTYRPIFVDLNNKKQALSYVDLLCFAPSQSMIKAEELLSALNWSSKSVITSTRKARDDAALRVCQRYAFKNASIFAYAE